MLRWFLIAIGALVAVMAGLFMWLTAPVTIAAEALPAYTPDPEHGRYVFWAAGCDSCHAAPDAKGDDKFRLGGGLALKTPFGTFYPPNISPDPNDGIGDWSDLDFVNAVMRGVSPEGDHYYPAFPWLSYQHMRIEDVLDLKAFLATLPKVQGRPPEHNLPLLFRFRRGIGIWKRIYMDYQPFRPDPKAGEKVNRGAYLVIGPGHCGECHTPRDLLGGPVPDRELAGGDALVGEGDNKVPNITPGNASIDDMSVDDIASTLKTGILPDFDTLGGPMAEVVQNLGHLTDADLEAIALYLKSLPPKPSEPPKE